MESLLKKIIVEVPLLILAAVVVLIISVNAGDSAPVVQEEPVEATEPGELEMSKHNAENPEYLGLQPEEPLYGGEPEGLVSAVGQKWGSLTIEEQYSIDPNSKAYTIIASVVPEINYIKKNYPSGLDPKLNSWQEIAHKITSPVTDLSEEERKSLITRFEAQLNDLYVLFENRS